MTATSQSKSLIQRLIDWLRNEQNWAEAAESEERSLSFGDIYSHVWALLPETEHPYAWINDLYDDGEGNTFAVISSNGKLYRAAVTITSNTVSLGEFQEVVIEFVPRTRMQIVRSKGQVRALIVAGSAVLNRGGEIDSRDLFDSFIAHIERTGDYPEYGFYHFWEEGQGFGTFRLGQVDWVGREGNLYLASVLFDDTELARAAVASIEKEPDFWGNSIGFKYIADDTNCRELLDVGNGITIPVYKRGRNHEISLLPEGNAAAWFTSVAIAQERAMDEQARMALMKIFEEDPDKAAKFLEEAGAVDRSIEERGLVTRNQTEAPTADDGTEEGSEEEPIIEVDDELVAQIVEQATKTPIFVEVAEGVAALRSEFDALKAELATERQRADKAESRLVALERDDSEKQREWRVDSPAPRPRATYRPREARQERETPDPVSEEKEVVANVLGKLPKY